MLSVRGLLTKILAELVNSVKALTQMAQGLNAILKSLERIETRQAAHSEILEEILAELRPGEAVSFRVTVTDQETGEIISEGKNEMDARIGKKYKLALEPLDAGENPTTIDGPAKFAPSDPSAVTINQLGPLEAEVTYLGAANADHILGLGGDSDLGPGEKPFHVDFPVHTIPGDALTFRVNVTEVPAE